MSEYLALATLAASAIGAGANYAGARAANSANANMNAGSMAFAANQANQAEWFSREMAARQEAFQRAQSSSAQDFSAAMMRESFGLNAYMAGTSYQRAMADMRASGLNPILAYKQGGASSPTVSAPSGVMASGATGSRPSPTVSPHRMENELSGAVSSAMQGAQMVAQLENMQAQRDNIIQDTALKAQQAKTTRATQALEVARAITEGVRPENIQAQTRTELGRPALVGAQAAAASQSAVGQAQENQRFREWGPRTTPADLAANVEAAGRRQAPTIRQGLDAARGYQVPGLRPPDHDTVNRHNQSIMDALRTFIERYR